MSANIERIISLFEKRGLPCEAPHPIPPMTDPLSKYWDQPSRSDILVDKDHAAMSKDTLFGLYEYSASQPTGVYEGKMWRRKGDDTWWLCWYGHDDAPGFVSNNYREILVV